MNTDYLLNFILNAKDNTAGAFEKLKGQVGGLQDQWSSLHTLITGGIIGSFAALITHSIELGDHLWTLHERTGMSVQALGGLSISAEQSDTSIQTLMRGSKNLSVLMTDAIQNPAGEAAGAFQKLGINIRDTHTGALLPLDQLLPVIADKFNTFKDGPEKSAAANYLFKRSGEEMLGMFKQTGDGLRANMELYKELGGHTDESAEASDRFHDKMILVRVASEGLWNSIAAALLPTLIKLADIYIDSQRNSDKYSNAMSITALIVKGLASTFMGLAATAETVGNFIAALAVILSTAFQSAVSETVAAAKGLGEIFVGLAEGMSGRYVEAGEHIKSGMTTINNFITGDAQTTSARVGAVWDSFKETTAAGWEKWGSRIGTLWDETGAAIEKKSNDTGKQIAAPVLKAAQEVKESNFDKELRKFADIYSESLTEMSAGFETITKSEKAFLELVNKPEWNKLSSQQQQAISDAFGVANAQEHLNIDMKKFNDLAKDAADYAKKFREEQEKWKEKINDNALAFEDLVRGINDQTEGLRYEGIEHDKYLARLQIEKDWYAGLIPTQEEYIDRLGRVNKAYDELGDAQKLKAMTEANTQMWGDIDQAANGFFQDLLTNGGDTFKKLGEMLKHYLIDLLYQMTLRQWVIGIGVSAGGLSGNAAAQMMGSGGNTMGLVNTIGNSGSYLSGWGSFLSGGSSLLNGGNSLASLLGGYSAGGAIGANAGLYAAFASSSMGQALGLSAMTTTAEGVGLTTMTSLGAAIPVIGWVIAAAAILYSLFGNKGGGPKTGGFAQTSGAGFERYFTPNQADAQMGQLTSQFQDSYKDIVSGLGGRVLADVGFAFGYDTDPNGTADNRVSAGVSVGGRTIWQQRDVSAGRDNEDLQKVMNQQAATAMAQAIKASDLGPIVSAVWKNVGTVTQEQLQNLVNFSQQLHSIDFLSKADVNADAISVENAARMTSLDLYKESAQKMRDLTAAYDGSVKKTQELAAASAAFHDQAVKMILAIDQISDQFKATITESKRSVEMTGLSGQPLRDYLQSNIDKLMTEMATETDPQKIQALGNNINQMILQMWGSLDPEVQEQQKQKYLSWFDTVGTAVQSRLDAIKATIIGDGEDSYKTVMEGVSQALSNASDKITAAADGMTSAAATMNTAANSMANGTNIVITVNTTTGEVGVSGQ